MKKASINFILTCFIFCFACNAVKNENGESKSVYEKSSGVSPFSLNPQKTEDIAVLGKVWGFLKYYHPAVASGKYNWDFELFKILPQIISCTNKTERNSILASWITSLGAVTKGTFPKIDSSSVKNFPDTDWLNKTSTLGDELSKKLVEVKNAKRTGKNYYVLTTEFVGNPVFKNEEPYAQLKNPDTGYRILSLFRYWNMIQYYYPNKHLIGHDWENTLTEFIPVFVNASTELEYKLAVSDLIAQIHDTHANMMCTDSSWIAYRGIYLLPVQITFIDDQAVVTKFYMGETGANCGLKKGDIITEVGGVPVEEIVKQKLPHTHASNAPVQMREIAFDLLQSKDSLLSIKYVREGKTVSTNIRGYPPENFTSYRKAAKDTCFKYITPEISYIYPGTIKNKYFPVVMPGFLKTKGMIIDLRCYPSEFIVFSLSEYLLPEKKAFVKFSTGNISTPGLFTFTAPEYVGKKNADYYKGKIVIIVNEMTQSQAEYTAMAFQCAPNVTTIGSTTAGADGNVSLITLVGGIDTYISGIGVYYPDGSETQRVGIPCIEVKPTIKGIIEGRDELLEKAVEIINTN